MGSDRKRPPRLSKEAREARGVGDPSPVDLLGGPHIPISHTGGVDAADVLAEAILDLIAEDGLEVPVPTGKARESARQIADFYLAALDEAEFDVLPRGQVRLENGTVCHVPRCPTCGGHGQVGGDRYLDSSSCPLCHGVGWLVGEPVAGGSGDGPGQGTEGDASQMRSPR